MSTREEELANPPVLNIEGEQISVTRVVLGGSEPIPLRPEEELMQDEIWGKRILRSLRKAQRGEGTGRTLEEYLAEVDRG